jgi:cytidine deaminase
MTNMGKTNSISFVYSEYENHSEIGSNDMELVIAAREAAQTAYAPYSKFSVGAAVRLESGIIVRGSNVENAAFPSGICAEQNVLSTCVSNYRHDRPVAIAIAAVAGGVFTENPVPPCGNCRQVIAEEESRNKNEIKIILSGRNKILIIESCSDLLPLQFNKGDLSAADFQ